MAGRYEEEDGINLYHMCTFFCEVYYDYYLNKIVRTRTCTSAKCLEDYAAYITLPDFN